MWSLTRLCCSCSGLWFADGLPCHNDMRFVRRRCIQVSVIATLCFAHVCVCVCVLRVSVCALSHSSFTVLNREPVWPDETSSLILRCSCLLCVWESVCVCLSLSLCVCLSLSLSLCVCLCVSLVCLCVCVCVWVCVCMCVCLQSSCQALAVSTEEPSALFRADVCRSSITV